MPLADTAAALGRHTPYVPKCSVGALLATLDADDRAWLVKALDVLNGPDAFTISDIADVLAAEGHAIRPATLRRHRKRSTISGCACP